MNVPRTNVANLADLHVQLSEFVALDMHSQSPPAPQGAAPVEPSMYAQRLERMMRTAPVVEVPAAPVVAEPSRCVRMYKLTCDRLSLICGAAVIPSCACAVLGPIGLVVPAALVVASIALWLLRGKPTQQILQEHAARAEAARSFDPRGM